MHTIYDSNQSYEIHRWNRSNKNTHKLDRINYIITEIICLVTCKITIRLTSYQWTSKRLQQMNSHQCPIESTDHNCTTYCL